ncbi:MAG TPA: methionine--tRNA ligase [Polyangiaceae bacterium]|nr:methionine--tRNA ligase [Polyangiaceae bacterium]
MTRRILVTAALPYANGHIHLGHLVEYIQTDIWVRFQRSRGNRALYICADDTHGTAIMIRARQEGRTPEAVIDDMSVAHQNDFAEFQIRFDNYGSTHSDENRKLCHQVWASIRQANLVVERDVTQHFDVKEGTFLADRFVKGTCPKCKSENQYGDSCEKCGATYSATDLINPVSTLSGQPPELRTAKHLFVQVEQLHGFLSNWTAAEGNLQPEIANYLKGHFLSEALRDWDVSRPAPYFGFEIPDAPGNFWYVWFDAPIGYIASTQQWCEKNGEKLDDWWRSDETEVRHFIGKDIVYFHTLFWPAMLKTAGFSLPRRVQVHGFLTVNGEKMSKRKGTFVLARTYLDHLDPAYLRYFYAAKLGTRPDDIDLNLGELVAKVNSDIVGKVVNLASRSARFVRDSGLSQEYPADDGLFEAAKNAGDEIADAYENADYARAMRAIMALADRANEYVDKTEPWKLKKDPAQARALQDVCTVILNLYRQLVVYLAPVLPQLAEDSAKLLNTKLDSWSAASTPLVGSPVSEFSHLMQRVDPKKVEALIEASKAGEAQDETATDGGECLQAEPLAPECTFDDFSKVDLRVARVVKAEAVPKADKLLQLTLSLGGGLEKTVFAGIKAAYAPEDLVGRDVVLVANLAPRKMKFGVSEGMVVAAGPGGKEVFLLSPDSGAKPGQRVH